VDAATMALFVVAYVINLVATPMDDQLTYEAARSPGYWQLPLLRAFQSRLALWHVANLARVCACGAAWGLVCYRASPRVVGAVYASRGAGQGGRAPCTLPAAAATAAGGQQYGSGALPSVAIG
jgi:hypothetical protein